MKKSLALFAFILVVSCSKNDQSTLKDFQPNSSYTEENHNETKLNIISDINDLTADEQNQNIRNTGFAALNIVPSEDNIEEFIENLTQLSELENSVESKLNIEALQIVADLNFENALSELGDNLTSKNMKFNVTNSRLSSKLAEASKSFVNSNTSYIDETSQKVFDGWIHEVKEFVPLHVIDKNDPTKFTILRIEMNNPAAEYTLDVPPGEYIYLFGTPRSFEIMSLGFDTVTAQTIELFYDVYYRYIDEGWYMEDWPLGFTDELDIFDGGTFTYGINEIPELDITPKTSMGLITVEKEDLKSVEMIADYDETSDDNTNAIWNWETKNLKTKTVEGVDVFYTYVRTNDEYMLDNQYSVNLTTNNGFSSLQDIELPGMSIHDNYRFLIKSSVEILINVLEEEAILFDSSMLNIFIAMGGELNQRYTPINDPVLEMVLIDNGYDRTTIDGEEFDWDNRQWDGYIRTIDLIMITRLSFGGGNVGELKITDLSPLKKAIFFEEININIGAEFMFEDNYLMEDFWNGRSIKVNLSYYNNEEPFRIPEEEAVLLSRIPDFTNVNVNNLVTSVRPDFLTNRYENFFQKFNPEIIESVTNFFNLKTASFWDSGNNIEGTAHVDVFVDNLPNLERYTVGVNWTDEEIIRQLAQTYGINYNIHLGECKDVELSVIGSYRHRNGNTLSQNYTHNSNWWNRVETFSGSGSFDSVCDSQVFTKVENPDN